MKNTIEDLLKVCGVNFAAITVSLTSAKEILQIVSLFVAIAYTLIKIYKMVTDKKKNDFYDNGY